MTRTITRPAGYIANFIRRYCAHLSMIHPGRRCARSAFVTSSF